MYNLLVKDTGEQWDKWPPSYNDNAATLSPILHTEFNAIKFAFAPDNGWTLTK